MSKTIINRKMYNTETATYIGSDSYSYPRDFNYYEEDLYLKTTGEFFLVGSGGPMSKYSKSVGQNEWSGSTDVFTPLSVAEAREWVEQNCSAETYIELFGEPEE